MICISMLIQNVQIKNSGKSYTHKIEYCNLNFTKFSCFNDCFIHINVYIIRGLNYEHQFELKIKINFLNIN